MEPSIFKANFLGIVVPFDLLTQYHAQIFVGKYCWNLCCVASLLKFMKEMISMSDGLEKICYVHRLFNSLINRLGIRIMGQFDAIGNVAKPTFY
jgi:hypothetical protein